MPPRGLPRSRWAAYKRPKGRYGARTAARIAWEGVTRAGRSRMGKKAARTRKRRGR